MKIHNKPPKDTGITNLEQQGFRFAVWIGGLARFVVLLGTISFEDLYDYKYETLNLIVGIVV